MVRQINMNCCWKLKSFLCKVKQNLRRWLQIVFRFLSHNNNYLLKVIHKLCSCIRRRVFISRVKLASLTDIGQPRASIQRFNWLEAFEFIFTFQSSLIHRQWDFWVSMKFAWYFLKWSILKFKILLLRSFQILAGKWNFLASTSWKLINLSFPIYPLVSLMENHGNSVSCCR